MNRNMLKSYIKAIPDKKYYKGKYVNSNEDGYLITDSYSIIKFKDIPIDCNYFSENDYLKEFLNDMIDKFNRFKVDEIEYLFNLEDKKDYIEIDDDYELDFKYFKKIAKIINAKKLIIRRLSLDNIKYIAILEGKNRDIAYILPVKRY